MTYDFIILGQGLAGSVLSFRLIEAGYSVLVLDESEEVTSSKVAAGIFNPITGKRGVKSWLVDELFPEVQETYQEMESTLNAEFLFTTDICKVFADQEQQNDFYLKASDPRYTPYLKMNGDVPQGFGAPFGSAKISKGGWLDVKVLLSATKLYLENRKAWVESHVPDEEIEIGAEKVMVSGFEARMLIDARGYKSLNSKLFGYLPFRPNKGEMLLVRLDQDFKHILNKNMFVLPKGDNVYLIGSTFENHYDEQKTEKGFTQLIEKFENIYSGSYEVLEHLVGVRPATTQRRPYVGRHPEHSQVFSFNGFGTKGVTLIPTFAKELHGFIENGEEIHPEANIARHNALFYSS